MLAATYLVVGATGDSLHYAVESPQADQDQGSVGFAHDHGDGHWHLHGSHHHSDVTATAKRSRYAEGLSDRKASSHHDHTTLILAIASAIELSLLASPPLLEGPQVELLIDLGESGVASASDHASLGPRGPPVTA